MQSKESRACEAGGYLGRLRRAVLMQVYFASAGLRNCREMQTCVYINAGLRLRTDHP